MAMSVVVFTLLPINWVELSYFRQKAYQFHKSLHHRLKLVHCKLPSQTSIFMISTLCLKKVPTFKLSVTLSNLNRFSKFLHCWEVYEIYYETHLTLGMLLHYLGKLKIEIFCRYSAHMEENANKLHLCTNFNSYMRITVYAECIYALTEYFKY